MRQCAYCRKWVRNKPLFGTLHLCLAAEDRAKIDEGLRAIEAQREVAARHGAFVTVMGRVEPAARGGKPYQQFLPDEHTMNVG